ncbi:MAG TPA: hypothetical protein VLA53_04040, partial [Nitrosopumilaceae archaeon]|nr:hypothetical protein [Nitrosopumilaceae archaeon]
VNSIFDYLLEDANKTFLLGIPLDEYLDYKKFRMIAEYLGNIKAKKFIDWYDKMFNEINSFPMLKLFKVERRRNIHRRIITPNLIVFMEPDPCIDGDRRSIMEFALNLPNDVAKKVIEKQEQDYLQEIINKERTVRGQPLATSVKSSIGFTIPNTTFADLRDECNAFLAVMDNYVSQAKQLLT